MKKCFVLAALIVALSISPFAMAKDTGNPKAAKDAPAASNVGKNQNPAKDTPAAITFSSSGTLTLTLNVEKDGTWKVSAASLTFGAEKKAPPEVKVQRWRLGKVVMVGPDAKVEVREYDKGIPKDVLSALPSEIRDKIARPMGEELPAEAKKALEAATRAMDAQALYAQKERQAAKDQAQKAQVLAARREAVALDVQEKVRAENAQALAAQKDAEALFAQALAARKEVQAVNAQIKAQIEAEMNAQRQQPNSRAVSSDISAKLDKILERLDRLEKDVDAIKTKKDK